MSVRLILSHSDLSLQTEKRFDADITIAKLKERLYAIVGTSPEFMVLQLKDKDGATLMALEGDDRTLASFGIHDYAYVHIIDNDPKKTVASLQDVSQVEKYVMSEEEYSRRPDTFRKFKEKMKQQQQSQAQPNQLEQKEKKDTEEKLKSEQQEVELAAKIQLGKRCQVGAGTEFPRRGLVMYIGAVDSLQGIWIGIKLDEPFGKNDGSLKGRRYFDCPAKYGVFVKPSKVEMGDFPEKGLSDDEDIMAEL